jgi:hypothetical protein
MKRIGLFIMFLTMAAGINAQNITNKEFALIDYDLKITDNFREDTKSLKDFYQSAEVHNKESEDKIKAILIHHLYYHLERVLEKKLEISILPINSFMQKVSYDQFGYPKASIGKALRKGSSPFYLKLKVTLDSKEETEKKKHMVPRFKLDITVYNDEGIIPVYKWHGKAASSEPLPVNKMLFKGYVKKLPRREQKNISLSELYDQAIVNLISNHAND